MSPFVGVKDCPLRPRPRSALLVHLGRPNHVEERDYEEDGGHIDCQTNARAARTPQSSRTCAASQFQPHEAWSRYLICRLGRWQRLRAGAELRRSKISLRGLLPLVCCGVETYWHHFWISTYCKSTARC